MSDVARIREQIRLECQTTLTVITPREIVPEAEMVLMKHGCVVTLHAIHRKVRCSLKMEDQAKRLLTK